MSAFDNLVFLLAEDSENDAMLMQRAFKTAGLPNPLHIVNTGEKVIAYLNGDTQYSDRAAHPVPAVLLLDLNMPVKSGFEILEWIRSQPSLRRLVVIVLTASNRSADADRAYDLGANFYLTKPNRFEDLVGMARCLHDWLHWNHFPSLDPESKPAGARNT